MTHNRHGMTDAPLQQPSPAPLRIFAMFDRDAECTEHQPAYSGHIPCTGAYRCVLCGTAWDDAGNVEGVHRSQQVARLRRDLAAGEALVQNLYKQLGAASRSVRAIRADLERLGA